ncbi:ATP-dependent transcriptional regulator, partial [Rhodobacteraceae bacterium WD3A24]
MHDPSFPAPSGRPKRRLGPGLAGLALAMLAACAPVSEPASRRAPAPEGAIPAQRFGPPDPPPPARANARIAQDILALSFRMESGREIARISRFEGPVRVALAGAVPGDAERQLDRLLARLRDEAGLDIARAPRGDAAEITVEYVPSERLRRTVPAASCFIVPRVAGWDAFLRNRRGARTDWVTLEERRRVAVFVPADAAPQERRDCLHEELGQALGPLNDIYRLSESVFNDDNIHGALTGFDMLVLRAYNSDALASGMTRAELAARLPALLAQLNPRGERAPETRPRGGAPRAWIEAIETAL